ncbi:MAG: helix-turn-helix domain-containing protein [Ferruginibacter sp.]
MTQIGIILGHEYKLLSVAAILDVFDTVNKLYKEDGNPPPFDIVLIHLPDKDVQMGSNYFGCQLRSIEVETSPDLVLIPSFATSDIKQAIQKNRAFLPWLKMQYAKGARVGSFCTGAFLLGASGLLNGKIATTHVDASNAFSAAFPEVRLRPDKTVTEDGNLYTSGGATSTFHLLLRLVQKYCGKEMTVRVAKVFAIDMDRHSQSYFSTFKPSKDHNDDLVATAQHKIESNYHDTATIEEMIKDIPSSRRNMVRRFKQVTGITPIKYLQQTRIEAAKKLLSQTRKQMNEVILDSGYNDPKSFRKVFRNTVGMTPTEYREKFQVQ